MRLIAEQYEKKWVKLVVAIAANTAFLVLLLKIFTPRYEINDDMFISMFIDGQMANKSNYILFCNYFLAAVLRWLYCISDNAFPIYCYLQYGMMLFAFTGIGYVLLRRCVFPVALAANALLLGAFAAGCYLSLTYTKTASVAATAGIMLILFGRTYMACKVEARISTAVGILLCMLSSTMRIESFGLVLIIVFPLGLYELLMATKEKRCRLQAAAAFLAPFMLMLIIVSGLYGGNKIIWNKSPYMEYQEFIDGARKITDFHSNFNGYGLMPDVYDSLNITPEVCEMSRQYQSYDDTEIWNAEVLQQISQERDKLGVYPKFPELIRTYAVCWKSFMQYSFIWGVVGLLLLCLVVTNKKSKYCAYVVAAQLFIFSCLYMLFIWMDRYLVTRIDTGMFLAISASFLWMMKTESLGRWKTGLCLVITTLAVFICAYQNRLSSPWYPGNQVADYSYSKQQIQSLIDDEHLFLVGNKALNLYLYSPLEPMPAGYRDKLYFSGGWVVRHPQVVEVLADYGLENPYRDVINNDMVYVIPNDIEQTMKYINHYYNENARAELVQDLTSELGINIYRIVA